MHERKKEFKCEVCNYEGCLKSLLDKHIASAHENLKGFRCELCNQQFTNKSNLKAHVEAVHEEKETIQM